MCFILIESYMNSVLYFSNVSDESNAYTTTEQLYIAFDFNIFSASSYIFGVIPGLPQKWTACKDEALRILNRS